MKYRSFLITGLVTMLAACEKDTKVKIPPHEQRLVVNGILRENDLFEVSVGKSLGILTAPGTSGYDVNNAMVLVFENGIFYDTLKYSNNSLRYGTAANKRVRPGNNYKLVVGAPGFQTADAASQVPGRPVIGNITRVRNARTNTSGEQLDDITVSFNDPGAEKNFYMLRVYVSFGGPAAYTPVYCIYTNDIDVERPYTDDPFSSESCLEYDEVLLRDDNFNGRAKQLKISIASSGLVDYIQPGSGRIYRPVIELLHISEAHFRYLKSLAAFDNSSGNPFAEPAPVYTNINKGYGIFTTCSAAVDSIR